MLFLSFYIIQVAGKNIFSFFFFTPSFLIAFQIILSWQEVLESCSIFFSLPVT